MEIQDYFCLLFGCVGEFYCFKCGCLIKLQSIDEMVDQILLLLEGICYQLLVLVVCGKKGIYIKLISGLVVEGFVWVCINGEVCELVDNIEFDKNYSYNIEVVVDCFVVCEGI